MRKFREQQVMEATTDSPPPCPAGNGQLHELDVATDPRLSNLPQPIEHPIWPELSTPADVSPTQAHRPFCIGGNDEPVRLARPMTIEGDFAPLGEIINRAERIAPHFRDSVGLRCRSG